MTKKEINLKKFRLEKGVTQEKMAEELKWTSDIYKNKETGRTQLTIDDLIDISLVFNEDSDFLLGLRETSREEEYAIENKLYETIQTQETIIKNQSDKIDELNKFNGTNLSSTDLDFIFDYIKKGIIDFITSKDTSSKSIEGNADDSDVKRHINVFRLLKPENRLYYLLHILDDKNINENTLNEIYNQLIQEKLRPLFEYLFRLLKDNPALLNNVRGEYVTREDRINFDYAESIENTDLQYASKYELSSIIHNHSVFEKYDPHGEIISLGEYDILSNDIIKSADLSKDFLINGDTFSPKEIYRQYDNLNEPYDTEAMQKFLEESIYYEDEELDDDDIIDLDFPELFIKSGTFAYFYFDRKGIVLDTSGLSKAVSENKVDFRLFTHFILEWLISLPLFKPSYNQKN